MTCRQVGLSTPIFLTALYVFAWMLPIFMALFVASILGKSFSFVGVHWQSQNLFLILMAALATVVSGLFFGFIAVNIFSLKNRYAIHKSLVNELSRSQIIFVSSIFLLSGFGLYKSFGGMIFEKNYTGASVLWLGYGAWSVTYLISLGLLLGVYLERYQWHWGVVFVTTILFMPFLLSGSRIDFLSFLLAEAIYVGFYANYTRTKALLGCGGIFVYGAFIAYFVSKVRYMSGLASGRAMVEISDAVKTIYGMPDGYFYLSTIGDIGVSVFQVIGLMHSGIVEEVGLLKTLGFYAVRMLPGSYFHGRPVDISTNLPEYIGAGALHALGEGYLVLGFWGCILVGAVFGVLGAVSACSSMLCSKSLRPFRWIVVFMPWLILIRGGWYQFFSVFKSIEVLCLILFCMFIIKMLQTKFSSSINRGLS